MDRNKLWVSTKDMANVRIRYAGDNEFFKDRYSTNDTVRALKNFPGIGIETDPITSRHDVWIADGYVMLTMVGLHG